jgi:hypothetical protein
VGDEGGVVGVVEADFAAKRSIGLKLGPSIAAGFVHFVIALPCEVSALFGVAAMELTGDASEGELAAAGSIEQPTNQRNRRSNSIRWRSVTRFDRERPEI